jgi:hypothetical protein
MKIGERLIQRSLYISAVMTIMSLISALLMPIAGALWALVGIVAGFAAFSKLKTKWGIVTSGICGIVFLYLLITFLLSILATINIVK